MIEIEIPQGVQVDIKGTEVMIKGSLGTNKRNFNDAFIKVTKDGSKIKVDHTTEKTMMKRAVVAEISFAKEMQNDINGVGTHYEINMQVVFAHFPTTVEVKGDSLMIKNLIGERAPRIAKIVGSTKIEVKGQNIRLYGTSKDDVSQTGANIRKACKIVKKDGRIFQDGIYYAIE